MENQFRKLFDEHPWDIIGEEIYSKSTIDVETALFKKGKRNLEDFKALISPAAEAFIEQMAMKANALTVKRFGKTIQLYVPMYLSNECQNICTYCGFSFDNKIDRITLTDKQILNEVDAINKLGFQNILLVTGEANKSVGVDYLVHAIELIKPFFAQISIEVQPMDEEAYGILKKTGLNTVLVYQETYNEKNYGVYHPKGKKSNFNYRLDTPDRIGKNQIHKIGLGVLLGLEEWRTDSFFVALHLDYLEKKYWQTKYSISFPRLRPNAGCFQPNVHVNDKNLLQLICAYRLFNENVELSLSTRESAFFRNNLIKLGITHMSAGSKTNPGGYATFPDNESLEQFEINDHRPVSELAEVIIHQGYEPVWKDWDNHL